MKYVKPKMDVVRIEEEIFLFTSTESMDDYANFNSEWIFEES